MRKRRSFVLLRVHAVGARSLSLSLSLLSLLRALLPRPHTSKCPCAKQENYYNHSHIISSMSFYVALLYIIYSTYIIINCINLIFSYLEFMKFYQIFSLACFFHNALNELHSGDTFKSGNILNFLSQVIDIIKRYRDHRFLNSLHTLVIFYYIHLN